MLPSPELPQTQVPAIAPQSEEVSPFVFVESEQTPPVPVDPWAHRRGEPRVFAFLWTLYVLVSVAGSILWLATTGLFTASGYGPAARVMLIVLATGVTLVCPMIRLSQVAPDGNLPKAIFVDTLLIQLPVQLVIWPLRILAGWPLSVVLAVSTQFLAWGLIAGGAVCLGLSGSQIRLDKRVARRTVAMLLLAGGLFAAPMVIGAFSERAPSTRIGWQHRAAMLSPFSGIPATTGRGIMGPTGPLSTEQERTILVVFLVAGTLWTTALVQAGLSRDGRRA